MELVFDKPVAQVEVNGVDAEPNQTMSVGAWQSTTVWTLDLSLFDKIHPPTHPLSTDGFPKVQVCFTVSYVDEMGIYQEDLDCVELPLIDRGDIPPRIIEGTVKAGDVGVDADKLNAYGFTFRFSKALTGYLEIRSESSGEDLCWIVEWSKDGFGESVKLSPTRSKGAKTAPRHGLYNYIRGERCKWQSPRNLPNYIHHEGVRFFFTFEGRASGGERN